MTSNLHNELVGIRGDKLRRFGKSQVGEKFLVHKVSILEKDVCFRCGKIVL